MANGQPNPYANCDPLGMVSIIQETDKSCPDDTGKGGYITITFREPVPLALTSLLDIDEGNTPDITLTYDGGQQVTFDTLATGDNGLYPLNIDTDIYKDVTMVDIKYWGSGSINSLVYRYCPETPTPEIQILKFAGPPGLCDASNIGSMEPELYTVPSVTDNWVYCYEISIPDSSSGECLYDVVFNDPAPIGGTGPGNQTVTQPSDLLCPGDKIYIEGDVKIGALAPEDSIDAYVYGTGQYSGIEVTDEDPAAVDVYEEVITLPPTPAPTYCPIDMGDVDTTICPPNSYGTVDTVTTLRVKSENNQIIPDDLDPSSIFYDMSFGGTSVAPLVSFKILNPFDFPVDMYIQYHEKAFGSSNGALDAVCVDRPLEPECAPDAPLITAGCIDHPGPNKLDFALVSVFFVSSESIFGLGGQNVDPYECCPIPESDANTPIIEYTFKILCECPPEPTSYRQLRGKRL